MKIFQQLNFGQMNKSTRNLIIGIGILSILAGIYSMIIKREMFDIIMAIVIGASLIGSAYIDFSSKKNKE